MSRRLVNLFSGRMSGIQPFLDHGWRAVTVEVDPRFTATITGDALDVEPGHLLDLLGGQPDFLWASVPCTSFSMASVRHHWRASGPCLHCGALATRDGERWDHDDGCDNPSVRKGDITYEPKSTGGRTGRALLRHTLAIVEALRPRFWVIENPRALMRVMPELAGVERHTVTHCQYGDPRRMKPTDLFGVFPEGFRPRACKNGDPCHEAAPRGAKTGTQGLKNAEERSLVPYGLPDELRQAIEAEL